MEYKFKGALTLKDYIQCCKILNRKRTMLITILTYIIFVSIFLSFNFYDFNITFNENPLDLFYIISSSYVVKYILLITLITIILDFIIVPIIDRQHYKSDKMVAAERTFCITDELISILTSILTIKERYLTDKDKFDELKVFINENFNTKKDYNKYNR